MLNVCNVDREILLCNLQIYGTSWSCLDSYNVHENLPFGTLSWDTLDQKIATSGLFGSVICSSRRFEGACCLSHHGYEYFHSRRLQNLKFYKFNPVRLIKHHFCTFLSDVFSPTPKFPWYFPWDYVTKVFLHFSTFPCTAHAFLGLSSFFGPNANITSQLRNHNNSAGRSPLSEAYCLPPDLEIIPRMWDQSVQYRVRKSPTLVRNVSHN